MGACWRIKQWSINWALVGVSNSGHSVTVYIYCGSPQKVTFVNNA